MLKSICCCERRSAPGSAVPLIGISLALVAIALVLQFVFAERTVSQAILFASFPMALIITGQGWKSCETRRSPMQLLRRVLGCIAMLLFFLAIVVIADRI